jgi:hypothetical protein
MPSRSEAQQKFFQAVYAYQTGKLSPEKASKSVKRVAKTISPTTAKKYTKLAEDKLDEILKSIASSPLYTEQLIREASYSHIPMKIKGRYVDAYTAKMISVTLDNLAKNNKISLLEHSMDEIVAISYKILTH